MHTAQKLLRKDEDCLEILLNTAKGDLFSSLKIWFLEVPAQMKSLLFSTEAVSEQTNAKMEKNMFCR